MLNMRQFVRFRQFFKPLRGFCADCRGHRTLSRPVRRRVEKPASFGVPLNSQSFERRSFILCLSARFTQTPLRSEGSWFPGAFHCAPFHCAPLDTPNLATRWSASSPNPPPLSFFLSASSLCSCAGAANHHHALRTQDSEPRTQSHLCPSVCIGG